MAVHRGKPEEGKKPKMQTLHLSQMIPPRKPAAAYQQLLSTKRQ